MTTPQDGFALRHEILILDAQLTQPLPEHGDDLAKAFTQDLLNVLHMEPLAPLAVYAATDDRAPGWSFIQPITTSHVSGHYFLRPGPTPHIHVDVYSCDAVDWKTVLTCLSRHFPLGDWTGSFIVRGLSLSPRSVLDLSSTGATITREVAIA